MRPAVVASGFLRMVVVAMTIVFTALVLVAGRGEEPAPIQLAVGQPAPETFSATDGAEVIDEEATDAARAAASLSVEDVYGDDPETTAAVLAGLQEFFADAEEVAEPIPPPDDPDTITPPTTLEPPVTDETATSEGAEGVEGGEAETTTTESTTTSTTSTTLPAEDGEVVEETTTSSTSSTTTTTTLPPPPREDQIIVLRQRHPLFRVETIATIVDVVNDDVQRAVDEEQTFFRFVEDEALTLASTLLEEGILPTELATVRNELVTDPPNLILLRDLPDDERDAAQAAVADLVAVSLQANLFHDFAATETAREEAAAAVTEVTVAYVTGEVIVRAGELVTPTQLEAILQLDLLQPPEDITSLWAMAAAASLIAVIAIFFLWRLGPMHWEKLKLLALYCFLIVLAALVARTPELVARDRIELGFLLPTALFGYLAANLFDNRTAMVMAAPVGAFAGLATGDVALAVYATIATIAPIPLVSAVSTRTQLNLAVIYSAVLHAPLAATIAWWFYGTDAIVLSTIFGAGAGLAAGVVALGVLPFLSAVFGITTTQTLLDLTDRNHPALRLIEEEAPGTFNHSIFVGNLAGKAARAVGGNPLLAQAMAYYHDLGKTVSPQYFVENQFGVSNPHDALPPAESAAIIRSHVAEGLRLARRYRIPPDVAQGILTHHGTSLMRYFYHKGIETIGEDRVDPIDFRHRGRKPKSKEMVIVMMSDATEAATRSMVQHEDPTSEGIRKLVEQVIAEKVEDGQLEESDVTFGELTLIKEAFVDALIGYYHTRIPYPGFPEPEGRQPA